MCKMLSVLIQTETWASDRSFGPGFYPGSQVLHCCDLHRPAVLGAARRIQRRALIAFPSVETLNLPVAGSQSCPIPRFALVRHEKS